MAGLGRSLQGQGTDVVQRREEERRVDCEPGPCPDLSSPKGKHQLWEDSSWGAASVPHLDFSAS